MKSKEEIIKSEPIFLEIFDSPESVYKEFEIFGYKNYGEENPQKPENIHIKFAYYEYENYSGDAFVLYYDKDTDKLYEVHGSHCSCYGLEGQWSPEECSLEGLEYRLKNGEFDYHSYQNNLKSYLNID